MIQMTNAGLDKFWDARSERIISLLTKPFDIETSTLPDIIKFDKILPVLLSAAAVCVLSCVVLAMEYFKLRIS